MIRSQYDHESEASNDVLINYLWHQQIIDKDNKLLPYNSVTAQNINVAFKLFQFFNFTFL